MAENNFTPSKYQQAIFDYIAHGNGHLVVEAAAGSGKTSTLVKSLDFIPTNKSVLLAAFNRDIVHELEKRTKGHDNVFVKTLHGLGLMILKKSFPHEALKTEEFKYTSYIRNNLDKISLINPYKLRKKGIGKYVDNIKKFVDFARFYLCKTIEDLDFIEERYGIDTIADEKEAALKVMEWGKRNLDTIDYTDMIWLPNALDLSVNELRFDFIMVDECQDMNKAERELVLKCFKDGTRMMSVGDANQMLYSFAGGDPNSFNALKSIPNTICLPLSISYRCAKNIVNFAKKLVPTIEYNEKDNREGAILANVSLDAIKDGDMILCRNNAPLIQVYSEFLKMGKRAYIKGKDIGRNLKKLVIDTKQTDLNANCRKDGVFARLYYDLFMARNSLMEKSSIDKATAMNSIQIQNKLDMIQALEILSNGITTADELVTKINGIFPKEETNDGISLSTIHKAKGLEANNVYIVCKSLMPSKSAEKDWEVRQEYNLMYVAYTRARNTLGFIDETDFGNFDSSSVNNMEHLKVIERNVSYALGKATSLTVTNENARNIVNNAKKISSTTLTNNAAVDLAASGNNVMATFSDLMKAKKIRALKSNKRWQR